MDWFDSTRLDDILKMFDNANDGRIPSAILLDKEDAPEDWERAVRYLLDEGCLKEHGDCFEITYRGKAVLHDGGFFRKDRRERMLFNSSVVAAVCSLLALIVSLVALICQIHG